MILTTAAFGLAPIVVLATIWVWWRPNWLGFEGKSLWDWIALLSVPLVVGFATFLISAAQARLERDRASELALQNYFTRVGNLVLDARLQDRPEVMNALGRAETMAILRLIHGERAGRAFAFLSEMDLLQDFAVEFERIDLHEAELKDLDLEGLDFEGSDLTGADLEGSSLVRVDFEDAILRDVDLKFADLRGVDLEGTDMSGADLTGANLKGVDLIETLGLKRTQLVAACFDASTKLPAAFLNPAIQSEGCDGPDDD